MTTLSIITINLNNATGLQKTIDSVAKQTFSEIEFIVIDGGSTDESRQLIDSYGQQINRWVSESDGGIYQAMNKGIKLAKNEYCLFLNSGDWLAGPAVVAEFVSSKPQADIVAGDVYYYDSVKGEIKWQISSPDQITAKALFSGTLPHQATFIRRDLFGTIGLYSEQWRIASDWLFFVEALLVRNCTYQHHSATVSFFNMDGISCNPETNNLPRQEQLLILRQKYPRFLPDYEDYAVLEKQQRQWVNSREYRVYTFMEWLGIIRLGVCCRSIKRHVLKRFTAHSYNEKIP